MRHLVLASLAIVLALLGDQALAQKKPLPEGYVHVPSTVMPAGGTCATPEGDIWFDFNPSQTVTGDTTGGANNVQDVPYPTCNEYTDSTNAQGPDDVWTITPGSGNALTFMISGDFSISGWDPHLYILGICGDASSCIAGSDDISIGDRTPKGLSPLLTAHNTYYIYIDSFFPVGDKLSAGAYSLHVNGTFPVSLQEFRID